MLRRRLVVVHQDPGPTIEGVRGGNLFAEMFHNEVRLRRARLLEAEDQTIPLEGVVSIPRERIVFCQLIARSG